MFLVDQRRPLDRRHEVPGPVGRTLRGCDRGVGPHTRRSLCRSAAGPGPAGRGRPGRQYRRFPGAVPATGRVAPGRRGDLGGDGRLPPPAAGLRRSVAGGPDARHSIGPRPWRCWTGPWKGTPRICVWRLLRGSGIVSISFSAALSLTGSFPVRPSASSANCANATRDGEKDHPLTADHVVTQFVRRTGLPEWLLHDRVTLDRQRLGGRPAQPGDRPGRGGANCRTTGHDVQGGPQ